MRLEARMCKIREDSKNNLNVFLVLVFWRKVDDKTSLLREEYNETFVAFLQNGMCGGKPTRHNTLNTLSTLKNGDGSIMLLGFVHFHQEQGSWSELMRRRIERNVKQSRKKTYQRLQNTGDYNLGS